MSDSDKSSTFFFIYSGDMFMETHLEVKKCLDLYLYVITLIYRVE